MNFHLFCNGVYVASYWTRRWAEEEAKRKSAQYAGNYEVREGKYTVGHGFVPAGQQVQQAIEQEA